LVFGIERTAFAIAVACGFSGRNPGRNQAPIFPAVDEACELAGRPAFFIDAMGFDQLFEEPNLIVSIEDREAGLEPGQFGVFAEYLDTYRMEGAEPRHPLDNAADQMADPLLHLAGG